MHPVVYILISGLLGVVGQVILKSSLATLGPLVLRPDTILSVILALALKQLILLGLAIYCSGTFFWLIVLSRVDLGYAYPFASLNYIFVLLGSWWLLGEQPTPVRIVGVVAICLGVWAIARTPASTTARKVAPAVLTAPPAVGGTER